MNVDSKVRLTNLTMYNWKCFPFYSISFNDKSNFYNQQNGFGKTSIIQAIIYCIYGKMPSGFKISDLQNNQNEDIKLELDFIVNGLMYKVKRNIYTNSSKKCFLIENGIEKELSINQINDKMESIFGDKKFIDVIWSQGPIINSNILKSSFCSNIISEYLVDEKNFCDSLKIKNLALSKERKKIIDLISRTNKTQEEIKQIKGALTKQRDALQDELKNKSKSSITDSQKKMAENCIIAKNRIAEIKSITSDIYSNEQISEYTRLKRNELKNRNIINNYSENLTKEFERFKVIFNARELSKLVKYNSSTGKCPVCESNFKFNFTSEDLSHFDEKEKFDNALDEINRLSTYNESIIELSKEYNRILIDANRFDDPQRIIDEFNARTDAEWEELNRLNRQIQTCEKIDISFDNLKDIDAEMKAIAKLVEISKEYEHQCINFYTKSIIFKATEMLTSIDDKYIGIFFDNTSGGYRVCTSDGTKLQTRAVETYSSGEKTVVALCLALSYKEIFAPNSVMILDESLGTLDPGHLENCLELIEKIDCQTIIVAHNRR